MEETTGVRRFVEVPNTWDGWAVRVLTVAIALTFVATAVLVNQLRDVQAFITDSRIQRTTYQTEEKVRQCVILSLLGSSPGEMRKLKC